MRISLSEHGGIGAAIRLGRPARVLDSGTLEPAATAELERLVTAAMAAAPGSAGAPRPDAMSYTITIENSGQPITLRASDADMSREFEALMDWLQARLS